MNNKIINIISYAYVKYSDRWYQQISMHIFPVFRSLFVLKAINNVFDQQQQQKKQLVEPAAVAHHSSKCADAFAETKRHHRATRDRN